MLIIILSLLLFFLDGTAINGEANPEGSEEDKKDDMKIVPKKVCFCF